MLAFLAAWAALPHSLREVRPGRLLSACSAAFISLHLALLAGFFACAKVSSYLNVKPASRSIAFALIAVFVLALIVPICRLSLRFLRGRSSEWPATRRASDER